MKSNDLSTHWEEAARIVQIACDWLTPDEIKTTNRKICYGLKNQTDAIHKVIYPEVFELMLICFLFNSV